MACLRRNPDDKRLMSMSALPDDDAKWISVEFRVAGRTVVGTLSPGKQVLKVSKQTVAPLNLKISDVLALNGMLHFITMAVSDTELRHDLIYFERFA